MATAAGIGTLAATHPLAVHGVVGAPVAVWLIFWAVHRNLERHPECAYLQPVVAWGFLLRLFFVALHLVVGLWYYQGGIDFLVWQRTAGEALAELVAGRSPIEHIVWQTGAGIGTFSTVFLLMPVAAVTGGTVFAMFLVCAAISTAGSYLFLRAFQRLWPGWQGERFLAVTLFLLPAIGFWSTFLGKDVLVYFLMGWAAYSLARLLERFGLRHMLGLAISVGLVLGVRPHVGLSVSLGIVLALPLRPFGRTGPAAFLRPIQRVLLFGLLSMVFVLATSPALQVLGLEELTLERLADRAYENQLGFASTPGATTLPLAIEGHDPLSVARFIPQGVLTLLFRPFLWEAHNVLAVAAGAENLLLMGLVLWRSRALMKSLISIGKQPIMLYALIVFVTASISLAFNWNLGTMTRHRTMVLPYLMILLAGPPSDRPAPRPWQRR